MTNCLPDDRKYAAGYAAGRKREAAELAAEMIEIRQRGAHFRMPRGRQAQLVLPDNATVEEVALFREVIMLYMQRLEQMLSEREQVASEIHAAADPEQPHRKAVA